MVLTESRARWEELKLVEHRDSHAPDRESRLCLSLGYHHFRKVLAIDKVCVRARSFCAMSSSVFVTVMIAAMLLVYGVDDAAGELYFLFLLIYDY